MSEACKTVLSGPQIEGTQRDNRVNCDLGNRNCPRFTTCKLHMCTHFLRRIFKCTCPEDNLAPASRDLPLDILDSQSYGHSSLAWFSRCLQARWRAEEFAERGRQERKCSFRSPAIDAPPRYFSLVVPNVCRHAAQGGAPRCLQAEDEAVAPLLSVDPAMPPP